MDAHFQPPLQPSLRPLRNPPLPATGFLGAPGYLNTPSCGIPNYLTKRLLIEGIENWQRGLIDPVLWDVPTNASRRSFARMVHVKPEHVSVGAHVSTYAGMWAESIPDDARVLVANNEFTSLLFPILQQRRRGVRIHVAPANALIDAIDSDTDWVAVSAVQSADGYVTDLAALAEKAQRAGARVVIDATQAAGWLPINAADFDVVIAAGYKWLTCPRGVTFAYFSDWAIDNIGPITAGWYAGADVHNSYYGEPLRLAEDARRFDVSPVWPAIVGAPPALTVLGSSRVEENFAYNTGLANQFAASLGIAQPNSAIVSVPVDDDVANRLREVGIMYSQRQGRGRFGFHFYNSIDDVDRLAECFEPQIKRMNIERDTGSRSNFGRPGLGRSI